MHLILYDPVVENEYNKHTGKDKSQYCICGWFNILHSLMYRQAIHIKNPIKTIRVELHCKYSMGSEDKLWGSNTDPTTHQVVSIANTSLVPWFNCKTQGNFLHRFVPEVK